MNKRVEIVKCQVCRATCKVGYDDDFLVYCACCKASFRPKDENEEFVTESEYRKMKENAEKVYEYHGWEAFK